jgi:hypothetical protein
VQPDRDRAELLGLPPRQHRDRADVDRGDSDVHELQVRLLGQDACDVVLEADPQPDERLAEQLALLALLEGAVELVVREQPLAQQQRAEMRARLVFEKGVVKSCGPHRPRYRLVAAVS